MSAPKNYTVKAMSKEPGFNEMVKALKLAHPVITDRNARQQAALKCFIQKIVNAGNK